MRAIRRLVALAVTCVAAVAMPSPSARAADPAFGKRPNIVLVITDDQGYGDLACHGNPVVKTPNIDKLYARSTRFTDFHASPTCAPSRAALLTGRHEFRGGVTHTINERERLRTDATIYPQVLKSAGYATGIFGKWHLGDQPDRQPDRRGFDEVFIHGAGGIGQTYIGSCGDAPGNTYFNPAIKHNGKFVKTDGYCTDVFFGRALGWIGEQAAKDQPFYAHIATNAPHEPLQCPQNYMEMYSDQVLGKQAAFFGMITNIDDNVGRLVAKLAELKLDRDTLLIFMTDNGGTVGVDVFNAGMRGQKVTPYNGGTRVPLFMCWPGTLKEGVDVDALTAHLDLFPTFAEITGAAVPADWQPKLEGRSLVPLLKDPKATWPDRTLFTHVGRWDRVKAPLWKYRNASVRNARFNLVSVPTAAQVTAAGTKPVPAAWALYDLKADPSEMTDVAARNPDVVRTLTNAYEQWWDSVQPDLVNETAPIPSANPFKVLYWKQFGGGPTE
jgi:arylsulfatase A-like enzyme